MNLLSVREFFPSTHQKISRSQFLCTLFLFVLSAYGRLNEACRCVCVSMYVSVSVADATDAIVVVYVSPSIES